MPSISEAGMTWRREVYKYTRIIFWSEEDKAFLVSVPDLPGCMADGKTTEEALANSEVIIREWIETALEDGRAVPEHACKEALA